METTPTTVPGGEPAYGYTVQLRGTSPSEARERIIAALKEEGFGVLTEIDVQGTLKKKLGADFRPYFILGACNPELARRALTEELGIGLLLPCNVCVWEGDGGAVVSVARPDAMFQVVANPRLEPIAREADERLRRALDRLTRSPAH